MFSDPQFWVAVSFVLFIAAIFNPVRKVLTSNLDAKINEIKYQLDEAENLKVQAQKTLSELKNREGEVEKEIKELKKNSELKISQLKELSSKKLHEQIEKRKLLSEIKIEQLIRDANTSIKEFMSNVAIDTATHILKNNLSSDKKTVLIDDSIEELKSVLKN